MTARDGRGPARTLGPLVTAAAVMCGAATSGAPAAVASSGPIVRAPAAVAPGGRLPVGVGRVPLPARIELLHDGAWRPAGPVARRRRAPVVVRAPLARGTVHVRAVGADGIATPSRRVHVRPLVLAAVGDINLGDGPGAAMERRGYGHPWARVGATLRAADIAFGNLECAVSTRGRPQPKTFVFRGRPAAVPAMARRGGIDVVNLANNHAGDYGDRALVDTIRHLREAGVTPVGAGASEAGAYRPRVVERLGLRVAFVGFSSVQPFGFRALGASAGTAWAFPGRVAAAVQRARRSADVVIAAFHWGVELASRENAGQRALAAVALRSGATAVIGAHPHVLQPIERPRRRLVAYSLGNFVWTPHTAASARTGILRVRLAADGVRGARLLRADIRGSRPVLR